MQFVLQNKVSENVIKVCNIRFYIHIFLNERKYVWQQILILHACVNALNLLALVAWKVQASQKDGPAASQIGDAGGTLVTRLNSNYACMGVPPDDMIGILTQTNIQSRIRKWRDKWPLIRLCSCVLPFLNALKRKGAASFQYSKPEQS